MGIKRVRRIRRKATVAFEGDQERKNGRVCKSVSGCHSRSRDDPIWRTRPGCPPPKALLGGLSFAPEIEHRQPRIWRDPILFVINRETSFFKEPLTPFQLVHPPSGGNQEPGVFDLVPVFQPGQKRIVQNFSTLLPKEFCISRTLPLNRLRCQPTDSHSILKDRGVSCVYISETHGEKPDTAVALPC